MKFDFVIGDMSVEVGMQRHAVLGAIVAMFIGRIGTARDEADHRAFALHVVDARTTTAAETQIAACSIGFALRIS